MTFEAIIAILVACMVVGFFASIILDVVMAFLPYIVFGGAILFLCWLGSGDTAAKIQTIQNKAVEFNDNMDRRFNPSYEEHNTDERIE